MFIKSRQGGDWREASFPFFFLSAGMKLETGGFISRFGSETLTRVVKSRQSTADYTRLSPLFTQNMPLILFRLVMRSTDTFAVVLQ